VVAHVDDVYGPVRSVGDLGIAIGNWPDAGAYPFAGYIDEVSCPLQPGERLPEPLRPVLLDGRVIDEILRELRQNEAFGAGGGSWRLLQLLARLTTLLRSPDAARTQSVIQLGQGLVGALQSRDTRALGEMHRDRAALAGEPATAHEVRVVQDEIEQLRSEPGLSDNLVKNLAKALCSSSRRNATNDRRRRNDEHRGGRDSVPRRPLRPVSHLRAERTVLPERRKRVDHEFDRGKLERTWEPSQRHSRDERARRRRLSCELLDRRCHGRVAVPGGRCLQPADYRELTGPAESKLQDDEDVFLNFRGWQPQAGGRGAPDFTQGSPEPVYDHFSVLANTMSAGNPATPDLLQNPDRTNPTVPQGSAPVMFVEVDRAGRFARLAVFTYYFFYPLTDMPPGRGRVDGHGQQLDAQRGWRDREPPPHVLRRPPPGDAPVRPVSHVNRVSAVRGRPSPAGARVSR